MNLYSKILPVLAVAWLPLAFTSCEKDPPPVPEPEKLTSVKVYPMFGNETLHLDSTYQTAEGYDVQFTDIKFFGGEWKHDPNFLTVASLFDYRETGNNFISTNVSHESFPSIQGYLGIDAATNHADPTAFPNEHPLNIVNAGDMHWGWNPGYIFIKVEAKVDTIPDGIPLFDHNVVLHIGTDTNLQTLDFENITWNDLGIVANGIHEHLAKMKLDMQQFLSNGTQAIDLKTEYISHSGAGQEALSMKAIQNFKAALSFMN